MDRTFGKYTLVERLGVGGMAEVFKARMTGPGGFEKYVAVKTILKHVSEDPEFVRMFIQEAKISARLSHTNIVQVNDFGCISDPQAESQLDTNRHTKGCCKQRRRKNRGDGTPESTGPQINAEKRRGRYYIAMEYVEGYDLFRLLRSCNKIDRPISVQEAILIGIEICKALTLAHGEISPDAPKIIHRDISLQNILLSRAGEVKITDFGIAKLASALHTTNTGQIKGKNSYMSPEQARGEVLDCRTDIFSAGCVLWSLLTGKKLFPNKAGSGGMGQLQDGQVDPPSVHNPAVPEDLDRVVLSALEKDRTKRIETASGLGEALGGVLSVCGGSDRSTALSRLFDDIYRPRSQLQIEGNDVSGEDDSDLEINFAEPIIEISTPEPPTSPDQTFVFSGQAEGLPTKQQAWPWLFPSLLVPLAVVVLVACTWPSEVGDAQETCGSAGQGPCGRGAAEFPGTDRSDDGVDVQSEAEKGAIFKPRKKPKKNVRKRPTRTVEKDFGWLSINVIPWAEVFWRGKRLGITPLERVELPVGRHVLVLVNEALGANRTVWVEIGKGRVTKRTFNLLDWSGYLVK